MIVFAVVKKLFPPFECLAYYTKLKLALKKSDDVRISFVFLSLEENDHGDAHVSSRQIIRRLHFFVEKIDDLLLTQAFLAILNQGNDARPEFRGTFLRKRK